MEFRSFLAIMKRHWLVIIVSTVMITALAVALSFAFGKGNSYAANTTCMVQPLTPLTDNADGAAANETMARTMVTLAGTINSDEVLQNAADILNNKLAVNELRKAISVSVSADSYLLDIKAKADNPDTAVQMAEATAQSFVASINEDDVLGMELRASVIITPTDPAESSSRNPVRNGIVGGFLGFLLGIGIAAFLGYMDPIIRSKRELIQLVQKPILTEIPLVAGAATDNVNDGNTLDCDILESTRTLRANVMSLDPDGELKTFLITSPNPREGRSFVSKQLARAFAIAGRQTLLIDADLRKMGHPLRPAEVEPGLVGLLEGKTELATAYRKVKTEHLVFMPSGGIPTNPSELLGSAEMKRILEEARKVFEVIVIDSSPLCEFADALLLAPLADGVIIVAEADSTDTTSLQAAIDLLAKPGIAVLGTVVNKIETKRKKS